MAELSHQREKAAGRRRKAIEEEVSYYEAQCPGKRPRAKGDQVAERLHKIGSLEGAGGPPQASFRTRGERVEMRLPDGNQLQRARRCFGQLEAL